MVSHTTQMLVGSASWRKGPTRTSGAGTCTVAATAVRASRSTKARIMGKPGGGGARRSAPGAERCERSDQCTSARLPHDYAPARGCRLELMWTALFLASLPLVAAPEPQEATSDVVALCERFTGFDLDGDGHAELERLEPLGAQAGSGPLRRRAGRGAPARRSGRRRRVGSAPARRASRRRPARPRAGAPSPCRCGSAPCARHQDGLYVLALREALRAFAAERSSQVRSSSDTSPMPSSCAR